MLAARDRGQEVGGAIELPRLGEELHEAEPAPRLDHGLAGDPLEELRRPRSVPRTAMRQDRDSHVCELGLDPERLEVVQEQLGILRPLLDPAAPNMRVPELGEQGSQLDQGPAPLGAARGIPLGDASQVRRSAEVVAACDVALSQVGADQRVEAFVELDEPFQGAKQSSVRPRSR